ncbi:hypothetical protein [Corynebacterium sp. NML130628]|uniref:hypothetical protein n=1 Tax=Corynebacterium sp. NML130628 TaxID=1906333 RepID=UPI000A4B2C61|nr:hypothetical protein [Corynebacterium sp. NML130628]
MAFRRPHAFATAVTATCVLGLSAPVFGASAHAQLPEGLDPAVIQQSIPSEIHVAAGQTTTVDTGVPLNLNYSSGGWTVVSSGTSVSVTAPDTPGATVSVPVSAGGYSATVNLVAVGSGEAVDAPAENAENSGNGGGSGEQDGASGDTSNEKERGAGSGSGTSTHEHDAPAAGKDRAPAKKVDTSNAKRLEFEGSIEGNSIVVKVPLSKAGQLMKYSKTDKEGATLRYVDVDGNIIEGVKRDVDVASRTLTLTYPEGETPDNPFIMEVIRDGSAAEFIAVITSKNAPTAGPTEESQDSGEGQVEKLDESRSNDGLLALGIAGVAVFVALVLIVFLVRKRRQAHN